MSRLTMALAAAMLAAAFSAPAAHAARSVPADSYIVVLKDNAGDPGAVADEHGRKHGAKRKKVWRAALKGYVAQIPSGGVAGGIDRIDQRYLPLSGSFTYSGNGAGVTAYVVDTGIHPTHAEFGGRAVSDRDFVDPLNPTGPYYNDGKDCNGHGTHVAGTIGGSTYGVAKGVSLRSVRVLDCQGYG